MTTALMAISTLDTMEALQFQVLPRVQAQVLVQVLARAVAETKEVMALVEVAALELVLAQVWEKVQLQ